MVGVLDTGREPSEQMMPKVITGITEALACDDVTVAENVLSKAISRQPIGGTLELSLALLSRRKDSGEPKKALLHFGANLGKLRRLGLAFQLKSLNGRTGFGAKAQARVLPANCGLRGRGSQGRGCKSFSNALVALKGVSSGPHSQTVRPSKPYRGIYWTAGHLGLQQAPYCSLKSR